VLAISSVKLRTATVNKVRRNHEVLLRLPRTICPEGYVPDFVMAIANLRKRTIRAENSKARRHDAASDRHPESKIYPDKPRIRIFSLARNHAIR
jgi:hypothetical protein